MKTVFGSHANTAHTWANLDATYKGKSSDGRMFFERGTIYSYGYHFPIASHVMTKEGAPAILFTTERYSVSTSKHISLVRQALHGFENVFFVPTALAMREDVNIEKMNQNIDRLLYNYARPRIRQTTRDAIAADIARALQAKNRFGVNFVEGYKVVKIPDDIRTLADKLAKEKAAKEKREAARRANEKEETLRDIEHRFKIPRTEWADLWRCNNGDPFQNWSTECRAVYQYIKEAHGILLRSKDALTIETSAGAEFPMSHARKAFAFIKALREKGEEWVPTGKTLHLGAYHIDKIDKSGNVIAGCHFVRWEEIALAAERYL